VQMGKFWGDWGRTKIQSDPPGVISALRPKPSTKPPIIGTEILVGPALISLRSGALVLSMYPLMVKHSSSLGAIVKCFTSLVGLIILSGYE
jgi:hypothetical protein